MRLARFLCRKGPVGAFTLIELMIVVVIVGVLAMVAVPLYQGHVTFAKMSEGMSGCGSIRTAMRIYASGHNNSYPVLAGVDGAGLSSTIGIIASDLTGKYFSASNYLVTSTATTYTIRATHGSDTYIINQDGVESGTYTSQ